MHLIVFLNRPDLQLDSDQQIATAAKMRLLTTTPKSPQLENNVIPEPNNPVLNINPATQLNDMDVVTNETAKEEKFPHTSSPSDPPEEPPVEEPLVDYDEMTLTALRKLCVTRGLSGQRGSEKSKLVNMLKAFDI